MANFSKILERLKANKIRREEVCLKRFGSRRPAQGDVCIRCGERMGDHYSASVFYCPDEWVAAGHELSVI